MIPSIPAPSPFLINNDHGQPPCFNNQQLFIILIINNYSFLVHYDPAHIQENTLTKQTSDKI